MTDTTWLYGYLGDTYADTLAEERAMILAAQSAIEARWPDQDDDDTRREALTGAVAMILGDVGDETRAREADAARIASLDAQARLSGAIIAGAMLNPAEGERARSERLGIARDTVRKALGKRRADTKPPADEGGRLTWS